jgi:hypothetical protein
MAFSYFNKQEPQCFPGMPFIADLDSAFFRPPDPFYGLLICPVRVYAQFIAVCLVAQPVFGLSQLGEGRPGFNFGADKAHSCNHIIVFQSAPLIVRGDVPREYKKISSHEYRPRWLADYMLNFLDRMFLCCKSLLLLTMTGWPMQRRLIRQL